MAAAIAIASPVFAMTAVAPAVVPAVAAVCAIGQMVHSGAWLVLTPAMTMRTTIINNNNPKMGRVPW